MARFPLFVNGAFRAYSPTADDEQLINWFPEILAKEAPGAVAPVVLYPTPGQRTLLTVVEAQGGRGGLSLAGRCFFVIGSKLVELKPGGVGYDIRGDVGNDGKPVRMVSSGILGSKQMVIASAGQVYCFDLVAPGALTLVLTYADGLSSPTEEAFWTHVGLSYGFFAALNIKASEWRISANVDAQLAPPGTDGALDWDDLQGEARALRGDPWVAMFVTSYAETWFFGEQTSEVWFGNGDPEFPYAPDPAGVIPYGIAAPHSVCEAGDQLVWLATTKTGDLAVALVKGVTPGRISDLALEAEFDSYTRVDDCEGETYRQGGHTFLKLTFPSERKTWLYDFQTQMWHRRGTWISEENRYDEWSPTWYAFFERKHLWCERESGRIVEVDNTLLTDADGRPMRRLRRSPTIRKEGKLLTHTRLEVLIEAGLGPTVNPQMMLRFSDDGGKTWGNELMQPMGNTGQYRQRLVWEKLGQSLARTYELSCSEASSVRVIDAWLEAD